MTTGRRIAQNRKNLGLSQEALGEKLGVSRQSIYKWESDAALPEIDKLITLSRLFGLSVGALLGVEDAPAEPGELTEAQLKMVEEITERYLAAAPKKPPRRWVLPMGALTLAVIALLLALLSLTRRLERMELRYGSLQQSIDSVSGTVDRQMDAIAGQVTDLLQSQNDLVSDYAAQVVEVDPLQNTVTFSFRATPKTFIEGTAAYLEVVNEKATSTYGPYQALSGGTFLGSETVPLRDDFRLSVIFDVEGVRFTQLLGEFTGLLSDTLPKLEGIFAHMPLSSYIREAGTFHVHDAWVSVPTAPENVASIRFGLFLDRSLLAWAEKGEVPKGQSSQGEYFHFPDQCQVPYESGAELVIAALVTDVYGREYVYPLEGSVLTLRQDGFATAEDMTAYGDGYHEDPAEWTFD